MRYVCLFTGTEKSYLPKDKQFLITRNVPCRQRASELINQSNNQSDTTVENDDGEEGWLSTNNESNEQSNTDQKQDDISDINQTINQTNNLSINESADADDEIQDIDDVEDEDLMVHQPVEDDSNDAGILRSDNQSTYLRAVEPADNIVRTRTYDLSIVYDKFYRVPRLYLFGYSETRAPLTADQMFEDISSEHALKTVTFEPHPFLPSISQASIHPCKHANVMKRLCDTMSGADQPNGPQRKIEAKDSMFVFLKFMTAVIPTIEYDFSMQ